MTAETTAFPTLEKALAMTELRTRSGFRFEVRPASPDDEPALADFFHHVSPDDLRFRFLSALDEVPHAQLALLTRVDHERTENYLAFDGETMVATAMLAADASLETSEVAISVRADYKGRGIGWTLLEHVARAARAKGIKKLQSIESCDNHAAIELEREMGFTARPYPGDATLILVESDLQTSTRGEER